MAYDEGLAERIREQLEERFDVEEKKMFGGLCFMISNHMACGIVGETLMARVGPKNYEKCLLLPNVKEMNFTGKPMRGMIYVDSEGLEADSDLASWINICVNFIATLPPKNPK